MQELPATFDMFEAIVGVFLPLIIAFFSKQSWSASVKTFAAFAAVFVVSIGHTFFIGELTFTDAGATFLKIFFLTITTYYGFWKPSGIAPNIEKRVGVKDAKAAALILIVPLLMIGCASTSGWQAYNQANAHFTGIAEQYETYYQLQEPEDQVRWQEKFDPVFDRGDKVLTNWRNILNADADPSAQQQAYMTIKNEIILILFELSAPEE
jgi:hypothetical protein